MTATIPTGSPYAALGSSFAAGPGIEPLVDEAAGRSGRNYAHLAAERLGLELTDLTRSGATSADLLHPARSSLGPRGLLAPRVPAQLDGVPADARLVTLTIGGNDLGYVSGLFRSVLVGRGPGRLPVVGPRLVARTRIGTGPNAVRGLTDRLTAAVERLHATAPQARVLIVDYLPIVGSGPSPQLPITEPQRRQARAVAVTLTGVYRTVARRTDAELVGTATAGRDHHAGAAEPWVTGWLGRGGVSFHPNAAGMAAVAELVVAHLDHPPAPEPTE